ncbi:MAG: hypothetical protein HYX26_04930 [Acidobacteriales bacterium]|nr:hypothetical protein [Terriglobales bacterium]
MTEFDTALTALTDHQVDFVVVGAVAAIARGATHTTQDLGICYERSPANLKRLMSALTPFHPRLRGVADSVPFQFDPATLANGMNFTLQTDVGDIDLLGELSGLGTFLQGAEQAAPLELFGRQCLVASLRGLIQSKRAAGRPKDLLVLPELEALLELETRGHEPK